MTNKICKKCNISKSVELFFRKTTTKNSQKILSYKSTCKECDLETQRIYRMNNKEKLAKRDAIYYQINKEHKLNVGKEYVKNNREKRNNYVRKYKKEKRLNDPEYKLYENLRKRIWKALKNKSESSKKLLGCDINYYTKWIEYTFTKNMSWKNYGKLWHIDHVVPIDSFDFLNKDEIKKAFNWKNTRALFANENMRKKNKIINDVIDNHNKQVNEFLVKNEIKMDNPQANTLRNEVELQRLDKVA